MDNKVVVIILIAVLVGGYILLPRPNFTSVSYSGEGVVNISVENPTSKTLEFSFSAVITKDNVVVFESDGLDMISSLEEEDPVYGLPANGVVSGFVTIQNFRDPGSYELSVSLVNRENEVVLAVETIGFTV